MDFSKIIAGVSLSFDDSLVYMPGLAGRTNGCFHLSS